MPCRVGITTDPEKRKSTWKNKVIGFRGFRIVKECLTRKEAQEIERQYAEKHGCIQHGGGRNAQPPWIVYRFSYTRKR